MLPYQNHSLPITERVEDLLGRMELNEKVAQLLSMRGYTAYERHGNDFSISDELVELYKKFPGAALGSFFRADWYSGRNWENGITPEYAVKVYNLVQRYAVENTRLGIPLSFGGTIHGLYMLGGSVFPSGIGQASTWDRNIVNRAARDSVEELKTICRGGSCSGPTQDLARDPRWSRVEETFGEDPFLSAELTRAYGEGIRTEGKGAFSHAIRHFTAHGEPEGGHNGAPAHVGMNELYNIHLPPFEAGVKTGARSLMTAYNLIDGYPCSIQGELINGLVRGKWGYKGYVIADAGAIGMLVEQRFARDLAEAAALVLKNGTDLCCWEAENFMTGLTEALARGLITDEDINRSVRIILTGKFEMGLFDNPYLEDETLPPKVLRCASHRETNLQMARESLILLSNPKKILPLKNIRKIALIGPNADNICNQMGDYTAPQKREHVITVRDGFNNLASKGDFEVLYAPGCKVRSPRTDGFEGALKIAADADAIVLVLGGSSVPETGGAYRETGAALAEKCVMDSEIDKDSGEGYDRAGLQLGGRQLDLLRELKKTGKPVVTVLIMGRPLILNEVCELSDAVLCAWYPGQMGGQAVAEAVMGLYNPGGKLPVSIPRSEGQLPVYYNPLRMRWNYIDSSAEPLFRFGYGLSYTEFTYSKPQIDKAVCGEDEENFVRVRVTNTGKYAGDEVVEMYVSDLLFSVARPDKELRGFERIHLEPGETREVVFPVGKRELGFYNRQLEYVVEPGEFIIHIGSDLEHLQSVQLEITE